MNKYRFIAVAIILSLIVSCKHAGKEHENYPYEKQKQMDYKAITSAICGSDAQAFASLCRYPISREYPIHDIEDSVGMVRYFSTLVDDSLKNVLKGSSCDDWGDIAWRGSTVLDGSYLWYDNGKIYAIPYQSQNELELLDSLRRADMSTLPDGMSEGWVPESCMTDSLGTVYRIDKLIDESGYRLMVFANDKEISNMSPSKRLTGELEIQGSAATHVYIFPDTNGTTWSIINFLYEDLLTLYKENDEKNTKSKMPLKKSYWLDFL